jgi:hypothetical protein
VKARQGRDVRIEQVPGLAVVWIVLRMRICSGFDMDPELVLERNARLAFASIALSEGSYWLRVALPSDSAALADPQQVIALVVDAARSLVPRCEVVTGAASVFDHYAT